VRRRDRGLLSQIEQGALDEKVPLATTLRRCVALGGQARSAELRAWASRELNGYEAGDEELPDWRIVGAPLLLDAIVGRTIITGKQISPWELPKVARDVIMEECPLRMGVAALESMLSRGEDYINLGPPGAADLVLLMNHENDNPLQQVQRVYWSISKTAITAVLDRIRTTLVKLVAELRAGMPDDADIPDPELASHALNVAVHGKRNRVTVTSAQSGVDASVQATSPTAESGTSRWKRWAKIGAVVVGLATIIGAITPFLVG
jgi:AbiTii